MIGHVCAPARVCLVFALASAVTGCPAPDGDGPFVEGPHPLFDADPTVAFNPLPDGRLMTSDGHLDLTQRPTFYEPFLPARALTHEADAQLAAMADAVAELTGWGTYAPFFVPFSEPLETVDAAGVHLVALDVDAGARGADVEVAVHWRDDPGFVEIEPREPLLPDTRYALVLEAAISPDAGLTRSLDFNTWATGEGTRFVDDAAQAAGVERDDVILAVEVQTDIGVDDLFALVENVEDHTPTVTFDADDSGRPRGTFAAADFDTELADWASDLLATGTVGIGLFSPLNVLDDGIIPAAGRDFAARTIELVVALPDPNVFAPPYPTVLMQHGFAGDNRFVIQNCEDFNAAGYAVVGIDAVSHGDRGSYFEFFNVEDVRRLRDGLRQTVLDHVQIANLVAAQTIDIDGIDGPDLDGSVSYFGHSMGAIIGFMTTTVLPEAPLTILSAPGGGIANILGGELMSGRVELLIRPALGLAYDDESYADALPFFDGMAQAILDRGDPINFAPHIFDARPAHTEGVPLLLIQEGVGDRLVPNATTADLGRVADVEVLDEARREASGFNAHWRTDPLTFGVSAEEDPHDTYFDVREVRVQAIAYLRSGGADVLDPHAVASE